MGKARLCVGLTRELRRPGKKNMNEPKTEAINDTRLFGIGVGSEICGDCGGATVTLDRCYIPPIYTNCKTCGGSGRVAKAKPMPNGTR